jgi:DNA-binding CsgD family transcriptional regulator
MLNLFLKSEKGLLGAVGLFRPSYASGFTARDKAKAELIVPYLVGILEEKMLSNHIMHCAKVFESVALGWPHKGIMLLDESLEPIYVSDDAYVLMASLCRKEHAHDRLQCSLPQELYCHCEELRGCAGDQGYTEPLQRQFTLTESREGHKLLVLLRLLMHENRPLFLVGFIPGDLAVSMHRRLNKLGLSQREAEVAWLVFNGMEPSELCDKLCISHHTVKSHLKAIYEKLGVHTRTSLIRRLTNLN